MQTAPQITPEPEKPARGPISVCATTDGAIITVPDPRGFTFGIRLSKDQARAVAIALARAAMGGVRP